MPLELRDLATDKKFEVPNDGATIGRIGSSKADLQLDEAGISNRHARVFAVEDTWFIEDLGSANGTFVGEHRVSGPTAIAANDVLTIARTKLVVVGPAWDPNQNQTVLAQPAMSLQEAQALLAAKPPADARDKTAPVGRPAVPAAADAGDKTAPVGRPAVAAERLSSRTLVRAIIPGCAHVLGDGCMNFFSKPTVKNCGAFPARSWTRISRRNASRNFRCPPPSKGRCSPTTKPNTGRWWMNLPIPTAARG